MKRGKRKKILFLGSVGLVVILLVYLIQKLVMPKFVSDIKEGSLIEEYYRSGYDNEVIFVGDCEVYESFVPSYLEKAYGIKSFIRGSASQRMWQSYYFMEETLQYEKPKLFVLSVQELIYEDGAKEEYNRMTLDGMRWSRQKWKSILASMNAEEKMLEYLFPLLRYKERIFQLTKEDVKYMFQKPVITDRGYLKQTGVKAMEELPPVKPLGEEFLSKKAMSYLKKAVELCRREGIGLVLMKAPIRYPHWYEEWEEEVEEFAKRNSLLYINFLEKDEETGITMRTDTYDGGLHLNYYGALKLTDYMGKELKQILEKEEIGRMGK